VKEEEEVSIEKSEYGLDSNTIYQGGIDFPELPTPQITAIVNVVMAIVRKEMSPIPGANELKAYAEVNPEYPDRVFRFMEREQDYDIEEGRGDLGLANKTLKYGLIFILLIVGMSILFALTGHYDLAFYIVIAIFGIMIIASIVNSIAGKRPRSGNSSVDRAQERLGKVSGRMEKKKEDKNNTE
jgi:uncharacterized membrane protein